MLFNALIQKHWYVNKEAYTKCIHKKHCHTFKKSLGDYFNVVISPCNSSHLFCAFANFIPRRNPSVSPRGPLHSTDKDALVALVVRLALGPCEPCSLAGHGLVWGGGVTSSLAPHSSGPSASVFLPSSSGRTVLWWTLLWGLCTFINRVPHSPPPEQSHALVPRIITAAPHPCSQLLAGYLLVPGHFGSDREVNAKAVFS